MSSLLGARHAILTGAGTGLDGAPAQALAQGGARDGILDVDSSAANGAAADAQRAREGAPALVADLAEESAVACAVRGVADAREGFNRVIGGAELAEVIAFLSPDRASYTLQTIWAADGGTTAARS